MKYLVAISFLLPASFAFGEAGQFRGHAQASQILSERILETGQELNFLDYFLGMGSAAYSILDLLGTYNSGRPGERQFTNGQPNSVNMLMYYLVLNGIAEQSGKTCIADQGLPLSPAFREALMKICAWPAAEAKAESVTETFWLSLMSYDAPESEYQAWRDFFLNSGYAQKPARETVSAMVLSLLYNPHFLLNK